MSICIECLKPMLDSEAHLSLVCPTCRRHGVRGGKVPTFKAIGKRMPPTRKEWQPPWPVVQMNEGTVRE